MSAPDERTRERKRRQIRAALALAEGAGTEAERDAAMATAMRLAAEHGIDVAVGAATGQVRDDVERRRWETPRPYSRAKADLLYAVATPLGGAFVFHGATGVHCNAVTVFAHTSTLEQIDMLYTSLLLQGTRWVARERPLYSLSGSETAAFRRAWWQGFADTVHWRLAQIHRQAAEEHAPVDGVPGAALVLADRKAVAQRAMGAVFGELESVKDTAIGDGHGYGRGAAAGERADLGTGKLAAPVAGELTP